MMPTNPEASANDIDVRPPLRAVPDASAGAGEAEGHEREVPIGTSDGVSTPGASSTRGARAYACARTAAGRATRLVTDGERWRSLRHRLFGKSEPDGGGVVGGMFRPPDVWSTDRPSLRKQLNYARYGVQHPEGGPLRAFCLLFAFIGLIPQAGLYLLAWITERPGRLIAGYGLYAVLMQIPAVHDLVVAVTTVLAVPLTWLA